jgi:hypothetical protein
MKIFSIHIISQVEKQGCHQLSNRVVVNAAAEKREGCMKE